VEGAGRGGEEEKVVEGEEVKHRRGGEEGVGEGGRRRHATKI